jgi:signal transduction histidine kinase
MQESRLQARGVDARELDIIHRAATRMNRLVTDLLDISLVEAGKLHLEKVRLSVRALVAEAEESQRALASSVELRVDVATDVSDVWADHDRILQVFENLIGNAIKFTAPGGRIAIGAARADHEIVFRIADTGCGIAPDALPHVFERFWQATKSDRRGAGLGLAIVRGIVEAHGGRVWVESTLGEGTTFSFALPDLGPAR